MINGWGAAMMGVIGVQIAQGYLTGEPFEVLASSMIWNTMAWFSLASVLFYILSGCSWGPMKKAELKFETALMEIEQEQGADEADPVIDHPACHSLLNFFIPILSHRLNGSGGAIYHRRWTVLQRQAVRCRSTPASCLVPSSLLSGSARAVF
ncbi:Uncharacterised protein [Klebsiella grimontii]|uniref:Uncharacterized protein n=1 Tax=Klebsiella grimontii TaxID=2058152 RepID=A0A7H4P2E9_9ENTR|nr:Uncharacterised protein [Klebsiella grimontii]